MSNFIIYKSAFGVDHEVVSKRSDVYNPEARRMSRNKAETGALATGSAVAGTIATRGAINGGISSKIKNVAGRSINVDNYVRRQKPVLTNPKISLKSLKTMRKPAAYAAGAAALGAGAVLNAKDRSRGGRPYKTWYS
jgi:hypothetical protein